MGGVVSAPQCRGHCLAAPSVASPSSPCGHGFLTAQLQVPGASAQDNPGDSCAGDLDWSRPFLRHQRTLHPASRGWAWTLPWSVVVRGPEKGKCGGGDDVQPLLKSVFCHSCPPATIPIPPSPGVDTASRGASSVHLRDPGLPASPTGQALHSKAGMPGGTCRHCPQQF